MDYRSAFLSGGTTVLRSLQNWDYQTLISKSFPVINHFKRLWNLRLHIKSGFILILYMLECVFCTTRQSSPNENFELRMVIFNLLNGCQAKGLQHQPNFKGLHTNTSTTLTKNISIYLLYIQCFYKCNPGFGNNVCKYLI